MTQLGHPDLHWLLFLWATRSYDDDRVLPGVEAVCATVRALADKVIK
jgi:hypothetical protein